MHRIDTATKAVDLFGAGKHGFGDGVAPGVGSTRLNASFFNALQEELAGAIEGAGVALPSAANDALLKTLRLFSLLQTFADGSDVALSGGTAVMNGLTSSLTLNAGRVIAVGQAGAIQTSPDGVTWTARTAAGAYSGFFSAVGDNASSLYVAAGETGEIQSSPDGTTWTHRTAAASYSGTFYAVAWGASKFVAVGTSGEIQSSPDGTTWTHRTAASSYTNTFRSVTFAASLFVAVGYAGEIQSSPDGVTWTRRRTAGTVGNLVSVAYGNGMFVAVSQDHYSTTSVDGITWTDSASAVMSGDGPVLYVGGGIWIALGPSAGGLSIDPRRGWVSIGSGFSDGDPGSSAVILGEAQYGYRLLLCRGSGSGLRITRQYVVA